MKVGFLQVGVKVGLSLTQLQVGVKVGLSLTDKSEGWVVTYRYW